MRYIQAAEPVYQVHPLRPARLGKAYTSAARHIRLAGVFCGALGIQRCTPPDSSSAAGARRGRHRPFAGEPAPATANRACTRRHFREHRVDNHDVAGMRRRMIERRREQTHQTIPRFNQVQFRRIHGLAHARVVRRAGDHCPGFGNRIDLRFGIQRGP